MSDGDEREQGPATHSPGDSDTLGDAASGAEGPNPAQGAPPIGGDEQERGQTQTDGADDDVGVPDESPTARRSAEAALLGQLNPDVATAIDRLVTPSRAA